MVLGLRGYLGMKGLDGGGKCLHAAHGGAQQDSTSHAVQLLKPPLCPRDTSSVQGLRGS